MAAITPSVHETFQSFDEAIEGIETTLSSINERPLKLCENWDLRHYRDGCE